MHFLAILFLANTQAINCKTTVIQIEMNECAAAEYERADSDLNRQWKITFPKIAAQSKAEAEKLLFEQRNWIKLRDKKCNEDFPWDLEGSARKMLFIHCRTDMTTRRTKLLAKLAVQQP